MSAGGFANAITFHCVIKNSEFEVRSEKISKLRLII